MLATESLWFRYQDEPVLKGVSLDFSRHSVTGLVGANGCGKSTLFMNLSGILKPQKGAVLWQGKPLDYSKRGLLALRQQVTTVFQDPEQQIFYTDIDSDIAFALRNLGIDEAEIARRVEEALTLVDAHAFRHQPIQCLSHGQKKRVAIAGALVLQAKYLLLDEPTAGLDPSGRMQMIEIIRRIVAQGNHVVISSHDIDLIYEVSDAVYVLNHGEVLAEGTPEAVFSRHACIQQAGLTQPWLVKLHLELGLPLCKNEADFFARMRATYIQEAS
ncbi:energy-coupling factor ABC transporter ATP-binding protein [Buttiauxella selenatireducens]|uniref:ABC transporter ATP-binding protein n=1 Tax=Buttiauxella selenatireducens TaxID=3073902 RepID=A0ABY9SCT7_9ENTR|nr:energy-coupling factor ABC transporter ATP-binding protein [Buttiauxella sp. R73]WMY75314.1 energy-coupling factor ABC transporter ATP-binding protein [Buttiauxella sp. R73]